ncbi:MAG: ATP-binding cassette domain-containing protein [Aquificae bacterium]|nr:ATP-binding cassette domain-containing protein [Aquificota bacterium]
MGGIVLKFQKRFPSILVEGEFTFEEGFNVILGPSGCGKTTTLRVMCGLEKPDEGFMKCCDEVFFDTREGIFLPPQRRKLGIVFQEDNLLPNLSVRGNIEFALRKAGAGRVSVRELMRRFGMEGLEDKRVSELSGGQRQRVAIIRALAYNPRALLMDEPFSSLDFRRKLRIIEFLKSLNLSIPVVLVTHDPFEASLLANKVFLMEGGKKVAEGGRELIEEYFSEIADLLKIHSS